MTAIPMDNLFRPQTIRWTVVVSFALHAAVFLVFAVRMAGTEIVPIGVEVSYLEGHKGGEKAVVRRAPAVRTAVVKAEGDVRVEKSAAATEAAAESASGPAGRASGEIVSALERYKYELRLFLESRKIYPETAKRLRQTGTVVVEFRVSPEGQLSGVSLSQASSSDVLNRAAVELVRRASAFKPFPPELQMPELQLRLPIEYIL